MRIVFLSHLDLNLYLFRLPVMKALLDAGHEVFALCPKGDKFALLQKQGIQTVTYEIKRQSLNPFAELQTIASIYTRLKEIKPDILHNFMAKPNIYGSIAGRLVSTPVIVNSVTGLGSFYIQDSWKAKTIRFIIEKLYTLANALASHTIFQNSDDLDYFVSRTLVKREKASLIQGSGIDTDLFSPEHVNVQEKERLRKELALEEKLMVLMVGRALRDKGVVEFYKAAKLLKHEKLQFVFVGGRDEGNFSCLDEEFLRDDAVKWLGHRDDIMALTALSDIYVLPSYREGLPRTLLEAASMQKPIVTTNTVGCKDVVDDNENGYLVPVGDADALAEKILLLAKDKTLREKFSRSSREKAKRLFDVKIIIKQYLQMYQRLIEQSCI